MRFRYLRIAFSVACAVACVLLIALWVRSYRQVHTLDNLHRYRIDVNHGKLILSERVQRSIGQFPPSLPVSAALARYLITLPSKSVVVASISLWIPALIGSLLAAAPWISQLRWHFTLRTLLIATTLVAAALGVIAAFR